MLWPWSIKQTSWNLLPSSKWPSHQSQRRLPAQSMGDGRRSQQTLVEHCTGLSSAPAPFTSTWNLRQWLYLEMVSSHVCLANIQYPHPVRLASVKEEEERHRDTSTKVPVTTRQRPQWCSYKPGEPQDCQPPPDARRARKAVPWEHPAHTLTADRSQNFYCALTSYFQLYLLPWAELCPLRICMLKP